jgi:hypothetical protein
VHEIARLTGRCGTVSDLGMLRRQLDIGACVNQLGKEAGTDAREF